MTDTDLTAEEVAISRRIDREGIISGWVIFAITCLFLLGVGILGWQVLQWLRDGFWTSMAWSDFGAWMGWPAVNLPDARGVEKIAHWLGRLPLFSLPLVLAFGAAFLWFNDKPEDEAVRKVRMKMANARYRREMDQAKKEHPAP